MPPDLNNYAIEMFLLNSYTTYNTKSLWISLDACYIELKLFAGNLAALKCLACYKGGSLCVRYDGERRNAAGDAGSLQRQSGKREIQ